MRDERKNRILNDFELNVQDRLVVVKDMPYVIRPDTSFAIDSKYWRLPLPSTCGFDSTGKISLLASNILTGKKYAEQVDSLNTEKPVIHKFEPGDKHYELQIINVVPKKGINHEALGLSMYEGITDSSSIDDYLVRSRNFFKEIDTSNIRYDDIADIDISNKERYFKNPSLPFNPTIRIFGPYSQLSLLKANGAAYTNSREIILSSSDSFKVQEAQVLNYRSNSFDLSIADKGFSSDIESRGFIIITVSYCAEIFLKIIGLPCSYPWGQL